MIITNVVFGLADNVTRRNSIAIEGSILVEPTNESFIEASSPIVVDAAGATVFPGFLDSHAHVFGMGERVLRPRLEGLSQSAIYNTLCSLPECSGWIVSRGWDQNRWERPMFPTVEDLDHNISTNRPIALTRIDGHALWCNSRALEVAGIDADTPDPMGGAILRDERRMPTGILLDEAMKLVEKHIPPMDSDSMKQTLLAGLRYFASKGHTGVHEMGVDERLWRCYEEVYRDHGNELPRSYVFLDMTKATGRELFLRYCDDPHVLSPVHSRLQFAGIKLYLDGALGSRGAELFEDYSDDVGNKGLALMDDNEVINLMKLAASQKLQIAVHAIGDKANARALALFEHAGVANSGATLRIEHAQIVRNEDLVRFKKLGVFALVQPGFYESDKIWAKDRIGDRMNQAYRWGSLLQNGVRFVASSDAPIEDPDPLVGIRLMTSPDRPTEQLSLEQAIRAYCETGYALSHETNLGGFLKSGMRADLTIVTPGINQQDTDSLSSDATEAEILATIVDGVIIFAKDGSPFCV